MLEYVITDISGNLRPPRQKTGLGVPAVGILVEGRVSSRILGKRCIRNVYTSEDFIFCGPIIDTTSQAEVTIRRPFRHVIAPT